MAIDLTSSPLYLPAPRPPTLGGKWMGEIQRGGLHGRGFHRDFP